MARKRTSNKKWMSRPSRKKWRKKKNRLTKPCRIRKNNLKHSSPTKPSRQRKKRMKVLEGSPVPIIDLEEHSAEEVLDARVVHDFLTER